MSCDKYLKVWFPSGAKFFYYNDKKTYEREKRFYGNNNIRYEERKIQKHNTLEVYKKNSSRLSGSSYSLIHNMRKNRMQDFEWSELMTDDELQDYILKRKEE